MKVIVQDDPLTRPAPAAVHPLPQRGEGSEINSPLPLWGRGVGGEGVLE